MTNANTVSLSLALPTLPADPVTPTNKQEQALHSLHVCISGLVTDDMPTSTLDMVKALLNDRVMNHLTTPAERNAFLTARRALIERRAEHPRPGKGETAEYFRLLARREDSLCILMGGPLTEQQKFAHQARATAYHALAAIERFTQGEASEPKTVEQARQTLAAIWTHFDALFGCLDDETRTELNHAYQDAQFK